jgi:hypothetical protein
MKSLPVSLAFVNELLTQDTNEAAPQTNEHVGDALFRNGSLVDLRCSLKIGLRLDSACVHEMAVINHHHEWDHRKAITWP